MSVSLQLGGGMSVLQVFPGEGSVKEEMFFIVSTRNIPMFVTEARPNGECTVKLPPFSRESLIQFIRALSRLEEHLQTGGNL